MKPLTPQDFGIPAPNPNAPTEDEWARNRRRDLVRQTWSEVPRHQLKWNCHPRFIEAAAKWDANRSLLLIGPTGSGKTTAAVRIVAKLCKLAVDVGEKDGVDYVTPARSLCWADAGRVTLAGAELRDHASKELLRRAGCARVLILDDFAVGSKMIETVLGERKTRGLPTVLTTGIGDLDQLRDLIGGIAVLRWVTEATGKRHMRVNLFEQQGAANGARA